MDSLIKVLGVCLLAALVAASVSSGVWIWIFLGAALLCVAILSGLGWARIILGRVFEKEWKKISQHSEP